MTSFTSNSSDGQLNGRPQNYPQFSNNSLSPDSIAMSRTPSLSSYVGSTSFASDAASQPTLHTGDAPQYEPIGHGLPLEFGLRNMNNENKVRVLKTPRVRRRHKTAKGDKASKIEIPAPLSQLTQHLHHVPIKDMEAWVNRTGDIRRRDAKKSGKIARPMNSFMMYRSAYAERAKEWCKQNNHQVVSCLAGTSWPMEPPEIREKYELLALVERDNHQKAHPEYKFAPNKTQTPPRKRRANNDNGSDADDSASRIVSTESPNPHKLMKLKSEYDSRESTPYDQEPLCTEHYQARWSAPIGRPLPTRLIAPHEQQHHGLYYMNAHGTLANMIRSSDDSHAAARPTGYVINNGYSVSTSLASIPGSINQELLRPYSSNSSTVSTSTANSSNHILNNGAVATRMDDSQLDPQLLTSHQAGLDMRSYNHVNMSTMWPQHDQDLGTYMPMSAPMGNNGDSYDPLNTGYTMQPLEEGQQVWAPCGENEGISGCEVVGKDFDQWIHNQNHHHYGGPQ
uniref:Transcription factor ste11 n=1 Tax=Talaromyces marneffei PM1 TaxID=1077442 RepID=A0A093V5C0_TALMA